MTIDSKKNDKTYVYHWEHYGTKKSGVSTILCRSWHDFQLWINKWNKMGKGKWNYSAFSE